MPLGKEKILIVARWPVGGIRTYFRYIYSQYIFSRYSLSFLMFNDEGVKEYLLEHCPNLDFRFVDCKNSTHDLFQSVRREIASGDYALIHSHGYTAGVMTSAALCFNKKIPHVMTAHEVFVDQQFKGINGKIIKLGMSLAFRDVNAIHAVSEDCKTNFLEFFPRIEKERVHTILHGIDTESFFSAEPRNLRQELELQDKVLLGFFGRFMSPKGFKYIVEAIELLVVKDNSYRQKLKVLTFGWGGFIREEFEAITEKGLADIFVQVSHTDNMPEAVKGVDVVLMPSLWEACGLLGMEALTAGTPIIGTNCLGLREVLEGSPAIVVTPGNSHQLAEAIEEILVKCKKEEFARYALVAKKRFGLEKPAQELEALYQHLLGL